jgi:RPA family protein
MENMAENQETKQQARQTAYIIGLDEINNAEYVVSEGEWDPNYMQIRGMKVSRVNILGVVIAVEGESGKIRSFTIDDGRSSIMVRVFESERLPALEIGEIITVIGRPRVFNDEKYLVPEIVKAVKDEGWIEVRRKQLETLAGKEIVRKESKDTAAVAYPEPKKAETAATGQVSEETISGQEDISEAEEIIALIRKFDFGNGADIEEIIDNSKSKNAEKLIMSLLTEGEIFEIKAGRVKVLE